MASVKVYSICVTAAVAIALGGLCFWMHRNGNKGQKNAEEAPADPLVPAKPAKAPVRVLDMVGSFTYEAPKRMGPAAWTTVAHAAETLASELPEKGFSRKLTGKLISKLQESQAFSNFLAAGSQNRSVGMEANKIAQLLENNEEAKKIFDKLKANNFQVIEFMSAATGLERAELFAALSAAGSTASGTKKLALINKALSLYSLLYFEAFGGQLKSKVRISLDDLSFLSTPDFSDTSASTTTTNDDDVNLLDALLAASGFDLRDAQLETVAQREETYSTVQRFEVNLYAKFIGEDPSKAAKLSEDMQVIFNFYPEEIVLQLFGVDSPKEITRKHVADFLSEPSRMLRCLLFYMLKNYSPDSYPTVTQIP
ncbi:hypothetical protein PAPHI01_1765 [Pancytospora philotis]|nr:hypothetical protein PAPHI01_1765 [Pancytospora philotis]